MDQREPAKGFSSRELKLRGGTLDEYPASDCGFPVRMASELLYRIPHLEVILNEGLKEKTK